MHKHIQRSLVLLVLAVLIVPMAFVSQANAEGDAELAFAPRNADVTLVGAGATFPEPLYQRLIKDYKSVASNVSISYTGIGSSGGIRNFTNGTTDFGGTDAVVPSDEFTGEELHVPMVMGPVVATYNVPGVGRKALQLTGDTLAKIFTGEITKWNDAAITSINPGRTLPDLDITVVYRADGSGTSSIFSTYLHAIDSANFEPTKNFVDNINDQVKAEGKERNSGVAAGVRETEGAIGYVEYTYARTNYLQVAWLQNQAGNFIRPSLTGTSLAAQGANYDTADGVRIDIVNPPDTEATKFAYPIAGFTWLLVHESEYTDLTKAQGIVDFIYWALQEGQQITHKRMGYSPLPEAARAKSYEQICKVKVDGTPAMQGNGNDECP
jgi:phosphate transport system substrate-binding protein